MPPGLAGGVKVLWPADGGRWDEGGNVDIIKKLTTAMRMSNINIASGELCQQAQLEIVLDTAVQRCFLFKRKTT